MAVGQDIDARVRILLDAQDQRREVERIDPAGLLTEEEAYALQFQYIESRIAAGDTIVGFKTGLTSRAKQETMGVRQPILGHILASSVVPEGQPVDCKRPHSPARGARDRLRPRR